MEHHLSTASEAFVSARFSLQQIPQLREAIST